MRYRAVAIGSERSNTVGTLELECTPDGLFVAYSAAAAFSPGYAPAALTQGTEVTVPWDQISEARVEGEQILVVFDPRLTPLNRLLLTRFTTARALPPEQLARRRRLIRWGSSAAALALTGLIHTRLLAASPHLGIASSLLIAVLFGLGLLGVGFIVAKQLGVHSGEPGSTAGFSAELGQYLPKLVRVDRAPPPARKPFNVSELQGFLPRTTIAIVITLSAGALGLLLVVRWIGLSPQVSADGTFSMSPRNSTPSSPARQELSGTESPSPAASAAPSTPNPRAPTSAPLDLECTCARADSLLWGEPLPRLSLVLLNRRVRWGYADDEERSYRRYTELEIAIVNNSREPVSEISMLILFYERKRSGKGLAHVAWRPLFFHGPLKPAEAVRWKVKARGTEFDIQAPLRGVLAPNGEDAAPIEGFAKLFATSDYRFVRMHAAMMLAFLGDERGKESILTLRDALHEDEAPYLNRLLLSQADLRVCQLHASGEGSTRAISACVYNASDKPLKDASVTVRGLDGRLSTLSPIDEPPGVLAESSFPLGFELAPRTGRSVRWTLDVADSAPRTYEAYTSGLITRAPTDLLGRDREQD